MSYLSDKIDECFAEAEELYPHYFTSTGQVREGEDPNFYQIYQAMGYFVGKETQEKYRKIARFYGLIDVLSIPGLTLAMTAMVYALFISFLMKENMSDTLIQVLSFLFIGPIFGYMFKGVVIESAITTWLLNRYLKALAQKDFLPYKRSYNLVGIGILVVAVILGILAGWPAPVAFLLMFFGFFVVSSLADLVFYGLFALAEWILVQFED